MKILLLSGFRYTLLISILILGLITITGTGGGDSRTSSISNVPAIESANLLNVSVEGVPVLVLGRQYGVELHAQDSDQDINTLFVTLYYPADSDTPYTGPFTVDLPEQIDMSMVYSLAGVLTFIGPEGTWRVELQLEDGDGNASNLISFSVTLESTITAVDDTATTSINTPVTVNVLANDTDADGDTLSVSAVTDENGGVFTDNGNGTITFRPDTDFTGDASCDYTVTDGTGTTTATFTVTVNDVNQPPVAEDDSDALTGSETVYFGVLWNDTDPDGDTLTITAVSDEVGGTFAINGHNIAYTPAAGFNGTGSCEYTISDGNGNTDTATLFVTVSGNPLTLTSIRISGNAEAHVGGYLTVTATGIYNNGSSKNITSWVVFTVDDTDILGQIGAGVFLGTAVGETTISASYNGMSSADHTVTVGQPILTGVSIVGISPVASDLAVGTLPCQIHFEAILETTYSDGTTRQSNENDFTEGCALELAGGDAGVLSINGTPDNFEGQTMSVGTQQIRADCPGINASVPFEMVVVPGSLVTLQINPPSSVGNPIIAYPSDIFDLTVEGIYDTGTNSRVDLSYEGSGLEVTPAVDVAADWSAGVLQLTVDASAIPGTVTLYFDKDDELGPGDVAYPVDVWDPAVAHQTIDYIEITVRPTVVGSAGVHIPIDSFTVALHAMAHFVDGHEEDVTGGASWSIEPASHLIGSTLSAGLFTSGTEAGVCKINVSYTDIYANAAEDAINVYVDPGALQSLTLIDADGATATTEMAVGDTNDYDTIGILTGSTTQYYLSDRDLVYISSNIVAATIDASGVLTAVDAGTTQIIVNHISTGVSSSGVNVTVSAD